MQFKSNYKPNYHEETPNLKTLCQLCIGGTVEPKRERAIMQHNAYMQINFPQQVASNPSLLKPVCCTDCGDFLAHIETKRKQSMVQPINKSTPTYISDAEQLKQLNPKRT